MFRLVSNGYMNTTDPPLSIIKWFVCFSNGYMESVPRTRNPSLIATTLTAPRRHLSAVKAAINILSTVSYEEGLKPCVKTALWPDLVSPGQWRCPTLISKTSSSILDPFRGFHPYQLARNMSLSKIQIFISKMSEWVSMSEWALRVSKYQYKSVWVSEWMSMRGYEWKWVNEQVGEQVSGWVSKWVWVLVSMSEWVSKQVSERANEWVNKQVSEHVCLRASTWVSEWASEWACE